MNNFKYGFYKTLEFILDKVGIKVQPDPAIYDFNAKRTSDDHINDKYDLGDVSEFEEDFNNNKLSSTVSENGFSTAPDISGGMKIQVGDFFSINNKNMVLQIEFIDNGYVYLKDILDSGVEIKFPLNEFHVFFTNVNYELPLK